MCACGEFVVCGFFFYNLLLVFLSMQVQFSIYRSRCFLFVWLECLYVNTCIYLQKLIIDGKTHRMSKVSSLSLIHKWKMLFEPAFQFHHSFSRSLFPMILNDFSQILLMFLSWLGISTHELLSWTHVMCQLLHIACLWLWWAVSVLWKTITR